MRLELLEDRVVPAGEFTDMGSLGLTELDRGSAAVGDYDNDGDLDLLITGVTDDNVYTSTVHRNDGNNNFADISAGLPGVSASSVDWGDYDNDGDLDILLTGLLISGQRISEVYRNDGNDTFTGINSGLFDVHTSSVAWGDYDNDGDLDILLMGISSSGLTSKVYRNDGADIFTDVNAGLIPAFVGSATWGDYDNDEDLDILLAGVTDGGVETSKLYRNDGSDTFTDINAGLEPLTRSSGAWGDYDSDGDLDILLIGRKDSVYVSITKLYRNDGSDIFTEVPTGLANVANGTVAWGDYDNDGDLDILLNGTVDNIFTITKLYRNENGLFTDIDAGLTPVYRNPVFWGDFDNDGKLDILTLGVNSTKFYRNNDTPTFTDMGSLGLPDLTHSSVAWGDYDNDGDLDILLSGRDASSERISQVYRNDNGAFIDIGASLTNLYFSSVAWGDYDSDGDLDILLSGNASGLVRTSQVYRNEGNDVFIDISAGLTGTGFGSGAWGDYDNDGDLDILLAGDTDFGRISRVYRNDNGAFTDISAALVGVYRSSVAWGDYDNDDDLDILLTGRDISGVYRSIVYRNDGSDTFTDSSVSLTGVGASSVAWGDYDNDGDLDILLTGRDNSNSPVSKVYRNDGSDIFTDISAGLAGVSDSSVAWGDYDNDGDLDILITGRDSSFDGRSRVYRNDNGVFTISAGLTGVDSGSVAWGDYDNDSDLDILLTGTGSEIFTITKILRNNTVALETLQLSTTTYNVTENAGNVIFTVTRTGGSTGAISVNYATSNGTAVSGSDYTAVSGTLNFADGQTSDTFTIPILDAALVEGTETFNLILSNPTGGAILGTATAIVNIVDDDAAVISISNPSVTEGGMLSFDVTMDNQVDVAVVANLASVNGTATDADADFSAISSSAITLFAAASTTMLTINVDTTTDNKVELNETMSLVLSSLSAGGRNVTLAGGGIGIGTIVNNDSAVVSLAANSSIAEGGTLAFNVTLTNPVDVAVTATAITADGTAMSSDLDYTALNSNMTLFSAGATTITVNVGTTADNKVELNETMSLMLASLSAGGRNVTFTGGAASLTSAGNIINNDSATISISNPTVAEGSVLSFNVTINNPVDVDLTANIATVEGSATVADLDYTAVSSTNVTLFAAGSTTTFVVNVSTTDDSKVELNEALRLELSGLFASGRNVNVAFGGLGGINNNDSAVVSISSPSVAEGGTLVFDVSISNPVDVDVTANRFTGDFTAKTADADYTPLSTANVTLFAANSTTNFSISVDTVSDNKVEADETLSIFLSGLSAGGRSVAFAVPGPITGAIGTIANDDAAVISINNAAAPEGDTLAFIVTLSNPVDVEVRAGAVTVNGTATTADMDFLLQSAGVTFAPGATSFLFSVNTTADNKVELDETLSVRASGLLANGRNVTFAGGGPAVSGTGTITNNDAAVISLADATVAEGGTLAFTLTMSNPVDVSITAHRSTVDGSATAADLDYTTLNSVIPLYPPGFNFPIILNVSTRSDNTVELDETLSLVLSNLLASSRNVSFAGNGASLSATGSIINNDSAVISISDASVSEGGVLAFSMTMSNPVDVAVTANHSTADGTATTANSDYFALDVAGATLFSAGTTSAFTVGVDTIVDNTVELDELISLTLSNLFASGRSVQFAGSAATLAGLGTITNDDAAVISISNPGVTEGGTLAFVVSISKPVDVDVSASRATANGSATLADSDYTALSPLVATLFAAGSTTSVTVNVSTTSDNRVELDETVLLVITALSASGRNVSLNPAGIGTIINDDFSEIDVRGNGLSISAGDITPSSSDHTDFGDTLVHGSSIEHTFIIANTGDRDLEFSNVQISGFAAADFAVTLQPTSPVAGPSGTTTFAIRFAPTSPGLRLATVTIQSNDADEATYTFNIQGEARQQLAPGETLTLTDEDGDSYRISIVGLGRATFELDDANANGRGSIKSIVLENTDPQSSTLRIVRLGGTGDRQISIGSITGTGVKQIIAPYSDLVGEGINLPGAPVKVQLRDILNGADIQFGGASPARTTIQARDIGANSDIELGSELTLKANSVGAGGVIKGTTIRKLDVARNFLADLDLSGNLASTRIGGGIADATWSILGNVSKLSIKSNTNGWALDIAGSLARAALGITNLASFNVGTFVGSFQATTFTNSHLYVGTSDALSFTTGGYIKAFAVGGKVPNTFANSMVAADRVGKVRLLSVDTVNSTMFGIRAGTSVDRVMATLPRFVAANLLDGADEGIGQFRVIVASV